ncbi:hypothetical protein [Burkholderia sp. LMG 32019]|uniref:hypothetical protein n=1 Tax=Burkholderia sp. LMG 32019 TaxID=3158173 RepID=UPI003C2BDE06
MLTANNFVPGSFVDDLGTETERLFVAERGRPPLCDARPTQIDPKRLINILQSGHSMQPWTISTLSSRYISGKDQTSR